MPLSLDGDPALRRDDPIASPAQRSAPKRNAPVYKGAYSPPPVIGVPVRREVSIVLGVRDRT
jgi:hypothetical protein